MIRMKEGADSLSPYYVDDGPYRVKLNANEGSWLLSELPDMSGLKLNLYPDSDAVDLRAAMAIYYGCKAENIMVGNGSSELLGMAVSAYCGPGDSVVGFVPSFGMYPAYAALCGAKYVGVPAKADFRQDVDDLIAAAQKSAARVVMLCTPNNPTGCLTSAEDAKRLVSTLSSSMVIIDEAYADFCGQSNTGLIDSYDNVLIMRTVSKAFGLAGIRAGCMIGHAKLIRCMWRVKLPYSLNSVSQLIARQALDKGEAVKNYVGGVVQRRAELGQKLVTLGFTVYPSGGNFLLVRPPVDNLYEKLKACGVLVRCVEYGGTRYCRITIGTDEENSLLLAAVKQILKEAGL